MIKLMTKKIAFISSLSAYLTYTVSVLAQNVPPRNPVPQGQTEINILPPNVGYSNLGVFISAALGLVFIIAGIAVLIMLVWGAVQWIFSGGEKEAVSHARNRILHALIGLAVLAVAFAIAVVFGQFVGVNLFEFTVPTPGDPYPFGVRQPGT